MQRMSFLIRLVAWVGILMVTSCAWQSQQPNTIERPDDVNVSIARRHPDARALLEKYPQADTSVDTSGRLAVDWRVNSDPATGTARGGTGLRLRVFIDQKTNEPTETLIECNGQVITKNTSQYLQQYLVTGACP